MITINLLPEELRIKEKVQQKEIPILKIALGAGIFFILLSILFYFDYLGAKAKLKKTNAQWVIVQPQSAVLNSLQSEVETVLKTEKDFLHRFVAAEMPLTHVLQWISDYLPERAWLTGVRLENNSDKHNLVIRGLCLPSKETSSIEFIEIYLHQLKEKMPKTKLSLTTARQIKDGMELTQFTAIFEWPSTAPAPATGKSKGKK